jgi:2-polyprenyl-6-methoxyphenol hydroxylase-like FAD-dependent oxidoreductase
MADRIALVIGGGIAGPAAALFLKKAGYIPSVFEAHAHPTDIGGGLQIAPNGMHVLRQLNLSQTLLERGVESAEICFENQLGKTLGCIPNGPASRYRTPAVQIGRSVLHEALLAELSRQNIPIHYSKRLQDIAFGDREVAIRFEDGGHASGSILMGADGIHSRTRQILFPEMPAPSYTGLVTIGGFARHEALKAKDEKHQSRAHMIFGQNGFFGYGYYDRADPCAVMWWSHMQCEENAVAEEFRSTDLEKLCARVVDLHRGWTEPVELILRNICRLMWGPVYDLPALAQWHQGRVVLIGDAAHAISPHAGQGASLALEDALCIAKHLRNTDYEDAFRLYQQERYKRVEKIVAEARKRGESKHALTPGAAKIRDFMISLFLRFRGSHLNDTAYGYKATWE